MQDKVKVSVYKNTFDKNPKIVELQAITTKIKSSDILKHLSTQLQAISNKKKRQEFKQGQLPAITVSGSFKNGHKASDLLKHSGLIQIDIDESESDSRTLPELKKILRNDPYTFVLFTSVSGAGLKIFVRITGSKHLESFEALEKYYKDEYQIVIDPKCKDIGRLCFLSCDPDIFINNDSQTFVPEYSSVGQLEKVKTASNSNNYELEIETITQEIEKRKIDITKGYQNWLKLGFALVSALMERGRPIFHRLSQLNSEYDYQQTDKQYSNCLRILPREVKANSFFFLARENGIDLKILKDNISAPNYDELLSSSEIVFYEPEFNGSIIKGVKINYTKFNELLLSFGFQRFDISGDYIMVRIRENIIEEVGLNTIQDTLFEYLKTLPEILDKGVPKEMLIEKFNKSPETYFSKKRYSLLRPNKEYTFVSDTKDKCFAFYRNGFVECTAQGWVLKDYKDLDGFIWKNQILERDFKFDHFESKSIESFGDYARFIFNISGKIETRFKCLCSIIGYNLHIYFEDKLKATILTDSKISDMPDGRTGKSLFAVGLSKIKKLCNIKGKDFDPADKFKYQEVDLDNQIIAIDDTKKQLDFEMLFNDITEGVKVNKKNLKAFTIKAKILITTNRTIRIEGASAKDRSIEFEFADYYSDILSPQDEFKKWFFGDDFIEKDWIEFDNFMMFCACFYLKTGIIKPATINLNRRKLLESTSGDFVEFMDEMVATKQIQPGEEYLKNELHDKFLDEYPEYRTDKRFSIQRNFTGYLKKYAKYTEGFAEVGKEDERKSNEKRYIRFMPEKIGAP